MEKITLLKEKTQQFKALLQKNLNDRDVQLWFDTLSQLFADIEADRVIPPTYFQHRMALGKEHPFEEPDSIYSHAYSEFMAALEDWRSQPWYAEVEARSKASLSDG